MKRTINSYELAIDQNSPETELRLKLSTAGFRFLTVTVRDGVATAVFEEQVSDKACNESFFVYNGDQNIRCAERYEYLSSFVLEDGLYHLYGYRTRPGAC